MALPCPRRSWEPADTIHAGSVEKCSWCRFRADSDERDGAVGSLGGLTCRYLPSWPPISIPLIFENRQTEYVGAMDTRAADNRFLTR